MPPTKGTMRVFVGVASSSEQHTKSLKSCFELVRRPGDGLFFPDQFGPGLQTRIALEAAFWESDYDAILMLDADQDHPREMLEKLREPELDMVCAHSYRRSLKPVESLCYALGDGTFPFLPLWPIPKEGLHEIALTGFGAVLIQRRVIAGVRAMLPKGASPFDVGPVPGLAQDWGLFGQDYRFFLLARKLGFKLWLRADVESLHGITLWLGNRVAEKLMDYGQWADKAQATLEQERLRVHGVTPEAFKQRKRILEARRQDILLKADELRGKATTEDERQQLAQISVALYQMDGKIMEMNAWIEWAEKYPKIERPDQLPTTQNTPPMEGVERPTGPREDLYQQQAQEMIQEFPDVAGA